VGVVGVAARGDLPSAAPPLVPPQHESAQAEETVVDKENDGIPSRRPHTTPERLRLFARQIPYPARQPEFLENRAQDSGPSRAAHGLARFSSWGVACRAVDGADMESKVAPSLVEQAEADYSHARHRAMPVQAVPLRRATTSLPPRRYAITAPCFGDSSIAAEYAAYVLSSTQHGESLAGTNACMRSLIGLYRAVWRGPLAREVDERDACARQRLKFPGEGDILRPLKGRVVRTACDLSAVISELDKNRSPSMGEQWTGPWRSVVSPAAAPRRTAVRGSSVKERLVLTRQNSGCWGAKTAMCSVPHAARQEEEGASSDGHQSQLKATLPTAAVLEERSRLQLDAGTEPPQPPTLIQQCTSSAPQLAAASPHNAGAQDLETQRLQLEDALEQPYPHRWKESPSAELLAAASAHSTLVEGSWRMPTEVAGATAT
jgi:hypothetical protein